MINKNVKQINNKNHDLFIENINKYYNPNITENNNYNYNYYYESQETKKKELLKKFKHIILAAAYKFKKMKLTINELYTLDNSLKVPYSLPKSKEFLYACRDGDYDTVLSYIKKDKHYTMVFDEVIVIII